MPKLPSTVRFTQSARKHRIGKARVMFTINSVEPISLLNSDSGKQELIWIAKDDRGVELEILGIVEDDFLIIIHVMPFNFRGKPNAKKKDFQ